MTKVKIGVCGLPNSGKSSFIKLVSKGQPDIGDYPFTTLKASEYTFFIYSPQLKELHQITQTRELIADYLIVIDIPGLIRGAHRGEGLGNEFLSYLRKSDVVLEIVRNFKNPRVPHPEGEIDPLRDLMIIEEEIMLSEKEILERNLKTLKKMNEKEKVEAIEKILNNLQPFQRFEELNDNLKDFNLLITKPWYLLVNGKEIKLDEEFIRVFKGVYFLDIAWELEILEIDEKESELFSFANKLRKDLDLIQFFTFNSEITQEWFVKHGATYFEAAGIIHSDFQKKMKSVEVIDLEDFKIIKNWELARKFGKIKTKGKNDLVKENEIIFIKS